MTEIYLTLEDIPFTTEVLEHGKEEDDSAFQQFEFPLGYKNLRKLMLVRLWDYLFYSIHLIYCAA